MVWKSWPISAQEALANSVRVYSALATEIYENNKKDIYVLPMWQSLLYF